MTSIRMRVTNIGWSPQPNPDPQDDTPLPGYAVQLIPSDGRIPGSMNVIVEDADALEVGAEYDVKFERVK
jgi:hypothetical protein